MDREAPYKRGCLSCRHWKKKVSTKWWLFLFNALKLSLLATYRLPLVVNVCLFFVWTVLFYRNRSRFTAHFFIDSHSQYILTPSQTQYYVTYNTVKYLCRILWITENEVLGFYVCIRETCALSGNASKTGIFHISLILWHHSSLTLKCYSFLIMND